MKGDKMLMQCNECGKELKKGDIVHQHVLEDERGYAAAGFNLCDGCNDKHKYHYGTSEYKNV